MNSNFAQIHHEALLAPSSHGRIRKESQSLYGMLVFRPEMEVTSLPLIPESPFQVSHLNMFSSVNIFPQISVCDLFEGEKTYFIYFSRHSSSGFKDPI